NTCISRLLKMVMQGGHLEDPFSHTRFFLCIFEIGDLQDYRESLYKKDSAKNGQQQLLMDQHGKNPDDSSQCKAAGITHKDLGRIGVIPEESDSGPDKSRCKHHQLVTSGNIHDIEVG